MGHTRISDDQAQFRLSTFRPSSVSRGSFTNEHGQWESRADSLPTRRDRKADITAGSDPAAVSGIRETPRDCSRCIDLLVAILLIVFATACSRLPLTEAVPATSVDGARVRDDDAHSCVAMANGQAHEEDVYAACMISHGYTTFFVVRYCCGHPSMEAPTAVSIAAPRGVDQIARDLRECEGKVRGVPYTSMRFVKVFLIDDILYAGPPRVVIPEAFIDCMTPRGYTVDSWKPKQQ